MEGQITATPDQRKRKRLSHACNLCRSRKVRCDEQMPTCRNCQRAGAECITTDPKKPEVQIASRRKTTTNGNIPSSQTDEIDMAQQLVAMENMISNTVPSISTTSLVQRNNPIHQ